MKNYEVVNGDLILSTNKSRIDTNLVHKVLCKSYWANGIPKEYVIKSIKNSLAFGLYKQNQQIGFCRLITDYTTFAYLADVFVISEEQGKGLAKFMIQEIVKIKEFQNLRRWLLATRDAHALYKKSNFAELENPYYFMEITKKDIYNNLS